MSEEIRMHCDICNKQIKRYVNIQIRIGDSRKWEKNGAWKYQGMYNLQVCDECIGEKIERCNGSHGQFGIKDYGIKLLRKLGILKEQ